MMDPFFFFFFKSEGHLLGLAGRGIYEMCFTFWPGCATMEKPKSYVRAGGQDNKCNTLRFILLGGGTQKERRMSGESYDIVFSPFNLYCQDPQSTMF